jgi:hypothetical protein
MNMRHYTKILYVEYKNEYEDVENLQKAGRASGRELAKVRQAALQAEYDMKRWKLRYNRTFIKSHVTGHVAWIEWGLLGNKIEAGHTLMQIRRDEEASESAKSD